LKITHNIIKEQIPDAKIILTGIASDIARIMAFEEGYIDDPDGGVFHGQRFTREEIRSQEKYQLRKTEYEYILKHGCNYYDVIDIHLQDAKIEFTEGKIKWLKNKLRKLGCEKPIWAIESGGPFKRLKGDATSQHGDPLFTGFTPKENAEFVVKMHIIAYSNGLERFQWSWAPKEDSFWDGPFILMPLYDVKGKPKPAYYTYMIMQYYLNGFDEISEITTSDDFKIYECRVGGDTIYIAWLNYDGTRVVDLSEIIKSDKVKIVHIVSSVDLKHYPIMINDQIGSPKNIKLTITPIFIVQLGKE